MPVTKEYTTIFRTHRHHIGMVLDQESCWEWRGVVTSDGTPICRHKDSSTSVPKVMWGHVFVKSKKHWPRSKNVSRSGDNELCVRPSHMYLEDIVERGKVLNKHHKLHENIGPVMKKLTREQAMEIRFSKEPNKVLAQRYGVAKCTISAIQHRRFWR